MPHRRPYILGRQYVADAGCTTMKGKNKVYVMEDFERDLDPLLDDAFLCMFQFDLLTRTGEWDPSKGFGLCSYIGALDFDFLFEEGEERTFTPGIGIDGYPPKAKAVAQILIDHIYPKFPCVAYYSGGKGLHVYVSHPDLMVSCADYGDMDDLALYVSNVLECPQLMPFIDASPMRLGCGLRMYHRTHPKSGVQPYVMQRTEGYTMDMFWMDIIDYVNKPDFPIIPKSSNRRIAAGTMAQSTSLTVDYTGVSSDMIESVRRYLSDAENDPDFLTCELRVVYNGGLSFRKQKFCPCKGGLHTRSACGLWYMHENHAMYRCLNMACRGRPFILRRQLDAITRVPEKYLDQIAGLIELPAMQTYVEQADMEAAINKSKHVLVVAPMGRGKTYSLRPCLPEYEYTIVIGTRILQTEYYNEYFNSEETPFVCYNTVSGDLSAHKRVCICLPSLMKLIDPDTGIPKIPGRFQLVCDEIESIVMCLTDKLLANGRSRQHKIWDAFLLLMRFASSVVMMDGIPTDITYEFLADNGILQNTLVIQHAVPGDKRQYVIMDCLGRFKSMLKNTINGRYGDDKGKCVVVSTEKAVLSTLQDEFDCEGVKSLLLTGDSDLADKRTSRTPTESWKAIDVLYYNNVVGPGPSCDVKNHFYYMYVFVDPSCGTPVSIYQLINRIRHLVTGKVYIFIKKRKYVQIDTIAQRIYKTCADITRFHSLHPMFSKMILVDDVTMEHVALVSSADGQTLNRALIGEKRCRLSIESNPFIRTHARNNYYTDSTNCSEEFTKQLVSLISRNGGVVSFSTTPNIDEKIEGAIAGLFKKRRAEIVANAGTYMVSVEDVDPGVRMAMVNSLIHPQYKEEQDTFLMLKNVWNRREGESAEDVELRLHSIDFDAINHGRVFSNLSSMLETVGYTKAIFEELGLTFDLPRGYVDGEFAHTTAYQSPDVKEMIVNLAFNLQKSRNGISIAELREKTTDQRKFSRLFQKTFAMLGFTLNSKRARMDGERVQMKTISRKAVDARNCANKRHPNNHNSVSKKEAFDAFFQKYPIE